MASYVLLLRDIDKTKLNLVGGKGANLGEMYAIPGINVPEGFCITTDAFKRIIRETPSINTLFHELSLLKVQDRNAINEVSRAIRRMIRGVTMPEEITAQINIHHKKLGDETAYAVRSSATAEDLPNASFAGQQESYLNVRGYDAILKHISKCWASLYTERAVIYRKQNGFDNANVFLSVIVQKMVNAQASGVLFTADPITNNRKIILIDAVPGLGDALVAGLVRADSYKVNGDTIISKVINAKPSGSPALSDQQILLLASTGRKIEKHFIFPQDIEWCLSDNDLYIVQSRPITTLYPVPQVNDGKDHVYLSVGHQQMMTDAMKPLGLSIWQSTAARPMYVAGGRLFVDVAGELASPAKRNIIVNVLGKSDPLIREALIKILQRQPNEPIIDGSNHTSAPSRFDTLKDFDPAIVGQLIRKSEESIAWLKNTIKTKSGPALIDFILDDLQRLKRNISDPQSFDVIMTGMNASAWINEKMNDWLGEKNVADVLTQSVSNNVTSEMGLALMDVADVIRPYPDVIEYLQHVKDDDLLDDLVKFHGGRESKKAVDDYLGKYGMRCVGEIDITKTRWSEKPTTLVPLILSNVKNFGPGESKRKFERGRNEALKKEEDLLRRLKRLPGGEEKAEATKKMIGLLRNLSGYREYPKYSLIGHYFIYKKALLHEAERLVRTNVIETKEDIYYLSLQELRDLIRSNNFDVQVIAMRRHEYKTYEKLTPPRVMTSDGEIVTGEYSYEKLPADAIAGLPVSSGIIEGRARVIFKMEDADLEEGDILVTTFTDPSWTPLFVLIKGLVTEVGGLMTHGAVIAREYGIPAVVGVQNATRLIKDKQRIRVHGTDGYIEII